MSTTQTIELNPYQQKLLEVPEEVDLACLGGRAAGKSYALALLALRHAEQYGERARILYIRKTYAGLRDFELVTRELFGMIYGTSARYNSTEHIWKLPGGGHLELGQIEGHADLNKHHGRSISLLLIDEAGQYATPDVLDLMRSNLRGSKDVPVRMVIAANPAGVGHGWIRKRYVMKSRPWRPFREERSRRTWVYAPGTFEGNQFIDRQIYKAQLEAACQSDPELLRAWVDGDWSVARGAFFDSVLDESRNVVDPWDEMPIEGHWKHGPRMWPHWLAHDFGSTAPSVTYLMAKSPGAEYQGKFYPRDSIVLVDELAAVSRDNLNQGLGWTAAITGEAIVEFCKRWKVKPLGVADDACFARTGHANSIAEEFRRVGVYFDPAKKSDRISGWQMMRRLLADAGKPDVPGLYVSRACEYFWATAPYLARDPKRIEDLDSSGADHGCDAVRYGLMRQSREVHVSQLRL